MKGKTILSPKSLLKMDIRSMIRMGTRPRIGMNHLMILSTLPNFLVSEEYFSTR